MQTKKIGKITSFIIVLATLSALFAEYFGVNGLDWLLKGWALILIILGLEFLFTRAQQDQEKFTFAWGSLTTAIVISLIAIIAFKSWAIFFADDRDRHRTIGNKETVELELSPHIEHLHIENQNASTEIVPVAGDQVIVTLKKKNRWFPFVSRASHLETYEQGNTLYIENKNEQRRFLSFSFGPSHPHLVIQLPQDHPLDISIEQLNGEIYARSLALARLFHAETTNGEIRVENLDGELILHTTNGDVEADGGAIRLLDMQTTNGDLRVEGARIEGDWKLSTTNGEVELSLPKQSDARLMASTDIGSIEVDPPFASEGTTAKGTVGNGTHLIEVSTTIGDIIVELHE
mgnify:FL=1|jgi:hypothetical protein